MFVKRRDLFMDARNYRNVFEEVGIPKSEIDARLEEIRQEYFFGDDRVYFEAGSDMGYIVDTGNNDARTEGMSYGMMLCVQLDMHEEFDRIWKWAKTYMWMSEGENEGYFAWSCALDGKKNAYGPAPDGEEYFAMALLFASHRWGDGEGIFYYSEEARAILSAMIHKGKGDRAGAPMMNSQNHQILFVPGIGFTDPSYHLPHFYQLFAEWGPSEDREFWQEASRVSRDYLVKACHPVTGFCAEYAEFDGSPLKMKLPWSKDRHDWFYSDSYRTVANIGLDYEWFKTDVGQLKAAYNIQRALLDDMRADTYHIYEVDGRIAGDKALHPFGITATVAESVLATKLDDVAREWVNKFFGMPMRKGERRYYDNILYFFAFLALSGRYKIW
jgi:oligosaccharide reducing-end xylanase